MISRAIAGLRHLFQHEPLRLLALVSNLTGLAYDHLDGGVALENVLIAVGIQLVTELGRAVVTSPATADPNHID